MQRWLLWGCLMLLGLAVGSSLVSNFTNAQDAAVPAAEAPVEPAAAAAPAVAQAPAAEVHPQSKSFILWLIETSGWIGAFLLILSVYFLSTSFRLFTELRHQKVMPPAVTDQCAASLEKRDLKGLYAVVKEDDSEYSRLVRAGIAELPAGISEARSAMERTFEVIHSEGERKISMLAVLGTLGPMIGLLGTLLGMIGAFSKIAMSEGSVLKASEVAGEISTALVLTFEGVLLSVPAIFLHAVFRNKISSLNDEAFTRAEELVTKVASMAKRPAPAAQAANPSA